MESGGARRRLDASSPPRRPITARRPGQSRARWRPRRWPTWGGHDAIAGLGGPVPARASTTPRRRHGPSPRRTGRRRSGRPTASPSGWPSSSARWPTARSPPWWGSGRRGCCPAPSGAATHGLIRTGHALRALGRGRHAAAPGRGCQRLGLLGCRATRSCRGRRSSSGTKACVGALADLPYLPEDAPSPCSSATGWPRWPTSPTSSSRRWRRSVGPAARSTCSTSWPPAGSLAYLRNADAGGAIGLLHAVTSPLACELVLPWLARGGPGRRPRLRLAGRGGPARRLCRRPDHSSTEGGAADRGRPGGRCALTSGDEHAIKLTEAALRAFGRTGQNALLLAAADACARL